ncbi:golgin subfamily A member 6-like protein 22 [Pecten maximus]|uniref:golgin subfamily A member 6-like protein 22 n=1 Tax=Pecten maximus TaxID=6579 RepID=UPI001457F51D|nr:golgin subfamily A member 6-like protein 22 [Pecten maximus]
MADHNIAPVFLKSDSVLGEFLLTAHERLETANPNHHESYIYDMVMAWMQDVCIEQVLEGLESENNALLGVDFWESLKNGTVWWTAVPGGLYVYSYDGQHLDYGSARQHDDLIVYHQRYVQCLEEHYTLVTTVEVSDPSQDWISQEMIKPHIRVIKEMLKFTDAHIRNALEILRDRGDEVTFASLVHILVQREDAVVNVYVGTRQYAFSADVQLVLHECYDIYGREPTQEEFVFQWNRIKGTGIEHLINQLAEKDEQVTNISRDKDRLQERARLLNNQVAMEQARAVQERNRADRQQREKLEVLRDADIVMEARNEAQELANAAIDGIIQEQNKAKALEETVRHVETGRLRLEKEKEEVRVRAVKLEKEKETIEKEKETIEKEKETIEKEKETIEKEKEEERVRAEEERVRAVKLEKEKEQLKQFFEEEKRKMMAQFEAEKRQLLLQMQQAAVYAR